MDAQTFKMFLIALGVFFGLVTLFTRATNWIGWFTFRFIPLVLCVVCFIYVFGGKLW